MPDFKLPAIGEGVVEGEIVRWLKQPGDHVAANEGLVEVMTDKATVEIPSPVNAVVERHVVAEGAVAEVGEVIAILGEASASASSSSSPRSPARSSRPAPSGPPSASPTMVSATVDDEGGSAPRDPATGRVLATPAARALARERGIDLGAVSGRQGRITKAEVIAAETAPRLTAPVSPPPARPESLPSRIGTVTPVTAPIDVPRPGSASTPPVPRRIAGEPVPDEHIPFRGMRRRIAEGMSKSFFTAVHYTYVEQIDVSALMKIRAQAKQAAADEGVKLSYLPFIMKAVILALKKFPIVNAVLDEQAGHITVKKRYSIGIATATDQGLMVPVVHDADRLSLLDIGREITRVSDAARAFKASREELTGSTFTITSLGTIGGVLATPILNYPEVGILGVHAIRKTPVVDENDQIVIGHLMNLSVSLDHRVVDGFEGASFLQEVKRYLEDPTLLLLAGI